MNAVDTNILFYVQDPRDPAKQAIASGLVRTLTDGVLLWQVACEYLAVSRKLEAFGYPPSQAWQDIRQLQQDWTTVLPDWRVLDRAERLMGRFSLSFYDALLIAACLEAGVTCLYSEDFDAYPRIDSLELINPFASP